MDILTRVSTLQLLLLIATTIASHPPPYPLTPRKTKSYSDPFIICTGLGPTHDLGLPPTFSEPVYQFNLALCSTTYGARQNVGCYCVRADGRLRCDERIADRELWDAMYTGKNPAITFREYCREECWCSTVEQQRAAFEKETVNVSSQYTGIEGKVVGQSGGSDQSSSAEGPQGVTFSTGGFIADSVPAEGGAQLEVQNQCGSRCESVADCARPANGSACTCAAAHSSSYQPGVGTVAFVAACIVSLAGGGKREETMPCPCNGTYVSHECCGVIDGLVWEAPEFKLGELARDYELAS